MQWSKLKKRVEARFAPSVAGRVELRTTNYRRVHDWEGRGWITVDAEEIYNFCTLKYWVERNPLVTGIREANKADWDEPSRRADYYAAYDQAEQILEQRGIRSQEWFENSLLEFLSLSLDDALASANFLHRALATLDRRLGKRRLRTLELPTTEHGLVLDLLRFRRAAESLSAPQSDA